MLGVIKDMRGDRDGLVRTPVKVLMVAGHAAFLFSVHVCVCVCRIERHRGEAGRRGDNSKVCAYEDHVCVLLNYYYFFLS